MLVTLLILHNANMMFSMFINSKLLLILHIFINSTQTEKISVKD